MPLPRQNRTHPLLGPGYTPHAGSADTLTTADTHTYAYDGLGRRIQKTVGSDTFDDYYNESWQALEVRKNADTDPLEQFVYDTAYIDAPVMRWYDSDLDGTADEQYYLSDASFSVIALLNNAGTVIERYRYTPYGQRIVMTASFSGSASTSSYDNDRGFQGLMHDNESGLIYNRARMLDPLTGRFLQRDPLAYPDGMNTYAAYHVMYGGVDPSGTNGVPFVIPDDTVCMCGVTPPPPTKPCSENQNAYKIEFATKEGPCSQFKGLPLGGRDEGCCAKRHCQVMVMYMCRYVWEMTPGRWMWFPEQRVELYNNCKEDK